MGSYIHRPGHPIGTVHQYICIQPIQAYSYSTIIVQDSTDTALSHPKDTVHIYNIVWDSTNTAPVWYSTVIFRYSTLSVQISQY